MSCLDGTTIKKLTGLQILTWQTDGKSVIKSQKNLVSNADYHSNSYITIGIDRAKGKRTPADIFKEWYIRSRDIKRVYSVLNNTIPDVLDTIFNSVDPNSPTVLNDVCDKVEELYHSNELKLDSIADAMYKSRKAYDEYWNSKYATSEFSSLRRTTPDAAEYKEKYLGWNDYSSYDPDSISELQNTIAFMYALRTFKLQSDITLYSGFRFSGIENVPKEGDTFETNAPLCTASDVRAAFGFHKFGDGVYSYISRVATSSENAGFDFDLDASSLVQHHFTREVQKPGDDSYILSIRLKAGDSAMPSSVFLESAGIYVMPHETEYTLPPNKYKVVKVDKVHKYIEIEPVRE